MGKLSGRPPLTEGKRVKKIDARFTEDEYRLIEQMEQTLGLKKTDLVRLRLLDNSAKMLVKAKELIGQLDRVGTELGRTGNNINQLARYAHTLRLKGALSPAVVSHFNDLLASHNRNQQELEVTMRRIIRALGK